MQYRHAQSRRINGRDQTVDEARTEELGHVESEIGDAAGSVLEERFSDARQHLGYALNPVQDEKHEWIPFRLHSGNVSDLLNPVGTYQFQTDRKPTDAQRRRAEQRTRETILQFEAKIRELGRKRGLSEEQIQALINSFKRRWEPPGTYPKAPEKKP